MDLSLSLVTGGTLFSLTKDDIANLKALYEKLGRSGVTTWVSTPSFAQMCLIERSFKQAMLPGLAALSFLRRNARARNRLATARTFPRGRSLEHLRPDRGDGRNQLDPH